MALEQGAFLLCALWVWLCALGGDRATRDRRALGGAGALLMTSMHMTLLGALLTLGPRAIYAHGTPGAWSASALEDQQLGGMVMLLGAGSSYLLGALVLLGAMLQRRRRPA